MFPRIGDAAKNAFHQNPKNTVFDAKRLIGRKMDEPSVKRDLKHLPFTVKAKNNSPVINVKYKDETREFVRVCPCTADAAPDKVLSFRPQKKSVR